MESLAPLLFLAQTNNPNPAAIAAAMATVIMIIVIGLVIGLAIAIVICILLSKCLNALPPEHRRMEPGMVWLLLIPLFNMIWNFFVFLRIPDSFQSYFHAHGRTDLGSCGRSIGLWYAICAAASIVPCVNYIAAPAGLVLLIIFLVKMFELKKQVELMASTNMSTPSATPPTLPQ